MNDTPICEVEAYQNLHNFFFQEHGLILLHSEMDDIITAVDTFKKQFNKDKVEVFEVKKPCYHGYDLLKRVNDISIEGVVFRQVDCKKCGKYRYKINLSKFHPALLEKIIFV